MTSTSDHKNGLFSNHDGARRQAKLELTMKFDHHVFSPSTTFIRDQNEEIVFSGPHRRNVTEFRRGSSADSPVAGILKYYEDRKNMSVTTNGRKYYITVERPGPNRRFHRGRRSYSMWTTELMIDGQMLRFGWKSMSRQEMKEGYAVKCVTLGPKDEQDMKSVGQELEVLGWIDKKFEKVIMAERCNDLGELSTAVLFGSVGVTLRKRLADAQQHAQAAGAAACATSSNVPYSGGGCVGHHSGGGC